MALHWPKIAGAIVLAAATLMAAETNMSPALSMEKSPTAPALSPTHHLAPMEYFRALLGMNPAQRERALARKSPADRALILAKIQEYEALPKSVREARLCQTELHWELGKLMEVPAERRASLLQEVSPLYQPMILGRLKEWDQVPPATRKALLERRGFIDVYLRMQDSPEAAQQGILDSLPKERRAHWAEEMDRWQALPEEERTELCAHFERFCLMSDPDRRQTVHALSTDEQRQMEEALRTFDNLAPALRDLCIRSFGKFATMAPAERTQFLQNAARWTAMTSEERELWRNLVHTLPPMPPMPKNLMPPMPPGFPQGGPPLPPMPPNVTAPVVVARSLNTLR